MIKWKVGRPVPPLTIHLYINTRLRPFFHFTPLSLHFLHHYTSVITTYPSSLRSNMRLTLAPLFLTTITLFLAQDGTVYCCTSVIDLELEDAGLPVEEVGLNWMQPD